MKYLVTGGAGFIGANFVKYMLKKYEDINIVVLDKLTYAGNLGTIREELKDSRVSFVKGDICNKELVENIFMKSDEKVIAKATRVEIDESNGKVYIVFEVTDFAYKKTIMQDWSSDIEFTIKNKNLCKEGD
jgi:dTDP-D-glucose 4,6-dehydratase